MNTLRKTHPTRFCCTY